MTLIRYSLGEIRRRPGRSALTLLGIVIGVAAMVAISLTIDATRRVYRDMFETLAGRAALEVVSEGMAGLDVGLVGRLREVPGVRAASPIIQTPAAVLGRGGATPVTVVGIDPVLDVAVRDYELREGRMLDASDGAVLAADFASAHGIQLGNAMRILTTSGPRELPVVGLLAMRGAAATGGGAVIFMPLATAQRFFNLPGQANAIALVLDESIDVETVKAGVSRVIPIGATVRAPGARALMARGSLASADYGFSAMSVVCLTGGAFVILNSLLMSLAERERHLAILRAIGATRRQIARLIWGEAAALGVVGTGLGLAVGWGLAFGFGAMMEQLLSVKLPAPRLGVTTLAAAAILGPVCTLLAAWGPAQRAARREPIESLKADGGATSGRWRSYGTAIGLVLFVGAGLFIALLLGERLPPKFAEACLPSAMAAIIVGMVLTLPPVLPLLLLTTGVATHALLKTEGDLAVRQLRRRPTRTALTVGVLAISIMVCAAVGNVLLNNLRDIRRWTERISQADFFVRGTVPDAGLVAAVALPESLQSEIAAIDGVADVRKVNFVPATSSGEPVLVMPISLSKTQPPPIDLVEGRPEDVLAGLLRGDVVIGSVLAHRRGLHIGDELELQSLAGPKRLRIAGIATEYTAGGYIAYIDWEPARRLLGLSGVHVFAVRTRADALDRVERALRELCSRQGYTMESCAAFRRMINDLTTGIVAALWMLMALAFFTASLGAINTLTMNVLEQTRELGVLRAVAMSRRQLRRFIVGQGLALGGASAIPGALGGLLFGYLMHLSRYPLLGMRVEYRLEWPLVAGAIVVAMVVVVVAALIPSRRAGRIPIIEALRYE